MLRLQFGALFSTKILQLMLLHICFETDQKFYEKRIEPCKNAGTTPFLPKAARGKIDPDRIFHLFFSQDTLCMFYIKKVAVQLKAI